MDFLGKMSTQNVFEVVCCDVAGEQSYGLFTSSCDAQQVIDSMPEIKVYLKIVERVVRTFETYKANRDYCLRRQALSKLSPEEIRVLGLN